MAREMDISFQLSNLLQIALANTLDNKLTFNGNTTLALGVFSPLVNQINTIR